MKIINKLTLRYLKANKKRTIFTILSIALSITMINAVGISLNSIVNYYKESIEMSVGDYHYAFVSNDEEVFEAIEKDADIKQYYYTNTNSYLDKEKDSYVSLKKGDNTFFKERNIEQLLIEGRLPVTSNEIVLTKQYYDNKKIGDTITLYEEDKPITFQIVGLMNEYSATSYYESSFESLSYVDLDNDEYYTITIEDKNLSENIFIHAQEIYNRFNDKIIDLRYNSSYLGCMGIFEEGSSSTFILVYSLVAVILAIIIIASIIIIYQAFNLSMNDKIKYLGMLSSVGATPKQKRNSVFFEGLFLTMIALPIGFFCSYLGMFITFTYMNSLSVINQSGVLLQISFSLKYTMLTIVLGVITVFISLIRPAIRLSRISVMNALKKNDEITVKKSKLKVGFIQRKLLKYDHQLAIKNYKRQGKRSRVIVISLVLSMVLFITMYSFTKQMYKGVINDNNYDLYDVNEFIHEDDITEYKKILDNNDKAESYYYYTRNFEFKAVLNQKYFKEELYNGGEMKTVISALDDKTFQQLCKDNDIEYKGEKQALIHKIIFPIENELTYQSEYIKNIEKDLIKKLEFNEFDENDNEYYKEAPVFDSIDYLARDNYRLFAGYSDYLEIIVPLSYYLNLDRNVVTGVDFCIKSDQHIQLCEDLTALGYSPYDQSEIYQEQIQTLLVVQIFVYGFICLMILFALLNIVNMMSASVDKRQKEFAMLLSVGMSPMGIKKMILYESLIYGFKTFLYGLPICIMIEYVMYKISYSNDLFEISYMAYFISFIVVLIVMLLTFKVGLKKLDKQNIIESLKDDM